MMFVRTAPGFYTLRFLLGLTEAVVNSIGNTGGFVGPYLLGALNDARQSFAAGLIAIAAMLAAGGALVLAVDDDTAGVVAGGDGAQATSARRS